MFKLKKSEIKDILFSMRNAENKEWQEKKSKQVQIFEQNGIKLEGKEKSKEKQTI